jgi:N-methylhydantoinase B
VSVVSQIDAVTFAVIRHKLHQVIDEAMLALENVSGAPNTAEAHDMMVSLYRADGGLMIGGVGFLHHLSSAAEAVKVIVESFSEDPGIDEGDIYMLNDSYVAALHPPDVYIVSPIYFGGALHGFVANFVHVVDIGAIDPGGFSPNSRNRFHEGFQTKGLKIVERGKARRDVFETFLNQVREPDLVALDIRSQIAANNVAIERMQRLYEEYGPEVVDAVSGELIRQSEDLMRRRLRELPDGTWRARQYLDYPDKLHRVQLEIRKQDDTLIFDFTGTSEQSVLGINASYWASWGGVLAPLYPLLAWDITWNEGMFRPISLIAPEGSLVNCKRPGPVSVATVAMIKICNNMSNLLLGKMLDSSPKYHGRASAVWDGMHTAVILSGRQFDGEGFIVSITDKFAGAGGAIGSGDGVDIGGELANGVSRWANAETHELHNPVLYLYRNALVDSGGAGEYRGGVTHEFALVPHKAVGGEFECGLTMKGLGIPMSIGLSGGYPGSNASGLIVHDANVDELPDSRAAMRGEHEVVQWGQFIVGERDILYQHYMGGGGYGDPIARDPAQVAADVRLGVVSPGCAGDVYGVALAPGGEADTSATRALRAELRRERIGKPVAESLAERGNVAPTGRRINAQLQVASDGYQCTWCGGVFGDSAEPWKLAAARREVPPTAGGPDRESLDGLELRQYFCPACATLLETEVGFEDDPPIVDEIERWPA